ncbi:MAG: 50S ribosomal protein L29, partial [Candidatus Pacebacteria bacterium]|nr:50S ribosomal protein L29 [Candidatus Paceibacterota bacterium]
SAPLPSANWRSRGAERGESNMAKKSEQIKEMLKQNKDSLQRILKEKQEDLRVFRFDLSAGKVKDVRAIRAAKKEIARINTILNKQ